MLPIYLHGRLFSEFSQRHGISGFLEDAADMMLLSSLNRLFKIMSRILRSTTPAIRVVFH